MLLRDRARQLAPAAALMLALPLTSCGEDEGPVDTGDAQERTGEDTEADDNEVLRLEELLADIDSRTGDVVSVTATVDEVVTPTVFAVGETPESVVVLDVAATEDVEAGSEVVVTGTVHEGLDDEAVEEVLQTQLEADLLNDWEGEPYLEADEVDTSPHA